MTKQNDSEGIKVEWKLVSVCHKILSFVLGLLTDRLEEEEGNFDKGCVQISNMICLKFILSMKLI